MVKSFVGTAPLFCFTPLIFTLDPVVVNVAIRADKSVVPNGMVTAMLKSVGDDVGVITVPIEGTPEAASVNVVIALAVLEVTVMITV